MTYSDNDPRGWCGDPKRGAAMGRPSIHGTPPSLEIRPIPLIDGYDPNGTYFGSGELLWWVSGEGTDFMTRTPAEVATRYPHAAITYPSARKVQIKSEQLSNLDAFVLGYLGAALYYGLPEEDTDKHGIDAFTRVALWRAIDDCAAFRASTDLTGIDLHQAGVDFFLDRNGHGTGFRDRVPGERGRALAAAAARFRETNVYAWKGKVYL